jgi:O-antigen/teichoic acid export membrane protein
MDRDATPRADAGDDPDDEPTGTIRRVAPAGWALGTRIAGLVATAITLVVLSRRLGPSAFGVFSVATSVALAASLVVAGGLNRVLLRDLARALAHDERAEARHLLRSGARALLCSGPVGIVVAIALGVITIDSSRTTVALAAVLAVLLGVILVGNDMLRPLREYRVVSLTAGRSGGVLVTGLFLLLILWRVTRPDTIDGALVLNVVAAVLGTALVAGVLVARARKRTAPSTEPSAPMARRLLLAGLPFGVTQVAMYVSGQVDLWVSGAVLSDTDTGLYAVAVRFMNLVTVPQTAAQLALGAVIPALFALGRTRAMEFRIRRAATASTLLALVVCIPCVVFPETVVRLVFGSGYDDAGSILRVLAIGQLVNVFTGLCAITLSLCGFERLVLVVALVSAVGSTVIDYAAAVLWGVDALAIAQAVTSAVSVLTLWLLAHRLLGIWTHAFWPTPRALARRAPDG